MTFFLLFNSTGVARQPLLPKRLQQRKNSLDNKRGQSEISTYQNRMEKLNRGSLQILLTRSNLPTTNNQMFTAKLAACGKLVTQSDIIVCILLQMIGRRSDSQCRLGRTTRDHTVTHTRGILLHSFFVNKQNIYLIVRSCAAKIKWQNNCLADTEHKKYLLRYLNRLK